MDKHVIANMRIHNQCLCKHNFKTPAEIVSWMGAMQAQEYVMAKWGIGVRLGGFNDSDIESAINNNTIVRTHVMRPTWHFVAANDIHDMLQLTGPRIKLTLVGYSKILGMDSKTITKIIDFVCKTLQGDNHLTRLQLVDAANNAGIKIDSKQLGHALFYAEVDRIVCNGRIINNKQTYCLLDEKIAAPEQFNKDEALAKLATKYFNSHGPATLLDFVWWSGLLASDAKKAIEIVKPYFLSAEIDSQTYIYPDIDYSGVKPNATFLLPAFDEFLVAYRDRKEVLPSEYYASVIKTKNGRFEPFVLYNGQVAGVWKLLGAKKDIEVEYFTKPNSLMKKAVDEAVASFKLFNS